MGAVSGSNGNCVGLERGPEGCGGRRERQGHPSRRDHHAGTGTQDPLKQAAQAPASPGRLVHGAAGDVQDLVGEARDQHPKLIGPF